MDITQLLESIQQTNFEFAMKIEEYNVNYTGDLLSIIHDIEVLNSQLETAQLNGDLSGCNRNLVNEERFYLCKNIEDIRHSYGILNTSLHNILLTLNHPEFQK